MKLEPVCLLRVAARIRSQYVPSVNEIAMLRRALKRVRGRIETF
jgi:hypothetical protein